MVDGRNPAPVDRWFIPLFLGFQPTKVVQDFLTIHRMATMERLLPLKILGYAPPTEIEQARKPEDFTPWKPYDVFFFAFHNKSFLGMVP